MTNWKSPSAVAETEQRFVRLAHVILGLSLWEIATTFDYELDVLRGKRPYRWTIWVHSSCRISLVTALVILIVTKDVVGLSDCTAWDASIYVFAYLSLALASSLVLLRVLAIWQGNLAVVLMSIAIWTTSIVLNIWYISILRSSYYLAAGECVPTTTSKSVVTVVGIIVSDFALLLVMLAGIVKHHKPARTMRLTGGHSLWRLMWQQGIVWLALATLVEVPVLVLVVRNLNDPWDLMFEVVTSATLAISATRMYRILSDSLAHSS
ncbi:hypothetical protein FA95DRAFT_1606294 [Auriscalpium vulgare]|uniref:Uncharacterized protein n=1 Tax=Auriscalpium vulgare TaxID=40419 RepID=A0ACB8RTA5_9AGAM|nr:hypothetical protein FA95DRAFT_1606294 [Auriscalpium vulgare]